MEREKVKSKARTSWGVVCGCIEDIVTCDSSDSDLNSDQSKPFVVLRRPQPHSDPCQITIDFAQHHEIKQVYVRSSARVYEIYCAASSEADNDYLCTVRCGPVESHVMLSSQANALSEDEWHSPTQSGSTANEDAWVDVQLSDSLKLNPMPVQDHNFQYLFEATAEVADADPVLSITLRLLSIQSGDYVRIDEVYVFSDPVVSADIDSTENSSGNSLMSMLIPTLMQLSKSRMSQIQQENDNEQQEKAKNKSNSAGFMTNALHSTMLNGSSIDISEPHVPLQKSAVTGCRDTLSSHIERSLDELVSRVANIEQFCLKLEEKLVKPISNMEARLVKIEQQLESFASSQKYRTSCTEILAPESESNYTSNDGMGPQLTKKWDSTDMDDCLVEEPSMSPSHTSFVQSYASLSTTVPHLLPSLVVTAPDFANIDDVEENETAETIKKLSSNECEKKPPSLDDALASALAGFLSSSASADLLRSSSMAGDCTCSEEEESNTTLPDFIQPDEPRPPSIHVNVEAKTVSYLDSVSTEQGKDKQDYDLGNKNQAVINKAIAEGGEPVQVGDNDINLYSDLPAPVASGPSENDSTCTLQVPGSSTNTCKVTDDALHDILNLPSPPVLDLTTCILDVEFSSQEYSSAKPPLEALLADMPLLQDEVRPVKETTETSFSRQNDLVFIGSETSGKNNEIWLPDPDFCCMSSNTEHEGQNFRDCNHASLI